MSKEINPQITITGDRATWILIYELVCKGVMWGDQERDYAPESQMDEWDKMFDNTEKIRDLFSYEIFRNQENRR